MFTKTAVVALVACMVAAVVAGSAAMALRPAAKPPQARVQVQAQAQRQPEQIQQVNCASCNLPPVSNCIPSGLSWDCQWCYVQQINAAGIFPSPVVWVVNGKEPRWAYYGPVAGTAGNGPVYLPMCP